MSNSIKLAHDANLGLPLSDVEWQNFIKKYHVELIPYDDMGKLTEAMKANTITTCYLPSANYYYFKEDPFYEPIANAIFAATGTTKVSSLLVVSKSSTVGSLADLKGKRLGYVHPYCTTSYFAPAFLLLQNHYSIHNFFSELVEVAAWQPQIDAVIAHQVDATMVQEDVWYKKKENEQTTKIIARIDNLPSPLFIISKNASPDLKKELMDLLLSHRTKLTPGTLFSGFVPYQKEQVQAFFATGEQALAKKVLSKSL